MTFEAAGFDRGFYRGIGAREFTQTTPPPPATAATALQTRILNMAAGTWERHMTGETGLGPVIADTGSDKTILSWAMGADWDPDTKRFYFLGGDHEGDLIQGGQRLIQYDAATDLWSIIPSLFDSTGPNSAHGYDVMAVDVDNGYFHGGCCEGENRWKIGTDATNAANWSLDTHGNISFGGQGRAAQAYMPGKGLYIQGLDGNIDFLDTIADPLGTTWQINVSTVPNSTLLHGVAEYSPIYDLILFGGGDSGALYTIDRNNNVVGPYPAPPFGQLNCNGRYTTLLSHDPITGVFLVMNPNGTTNPEFWSWDLNTWTQISVDMTGQVSRNNNFNQSALQACGSYGGLVSIHQKSDSNPWPSQMYVYRHAIAFETPIINEST